MFTAIYYSITRWWLKSFDEEPLAYCIGIVIFVLCDVYLVAHLFRSLLAGDGMF